MDHGPPHRNLLTRTLFRLPPVEETGQRGLENAAQACIPGESNVVGSAVRRGQEMEGSQGHRTSSHRHELNSELACRRHSKLLV